MASTARKIKPPEDVAMDHRSSIKMSEERLIRSTTRKLRNLVQKSSEARRAAPTEVGRIAQRLGFHVYSFPSSDQTRHVASIVDLKGKSIYINADYDPYEQAFVLAHEIGLIEVGGRSTYKDGGWTIDKEDIKKQGYMHPEKDLCIANRFAAELLLPQFEFEEEWDSNRSDGFNISELEGLFAVSPDMIERRAINLGLMMLPKESIKHNQG